MIFPEDLFLYIGVFSDDDDGETDSFIGFTGSFDIDWIFLSFVIILVVVTWITPHVSGFSSDVKARKRSNRQ